MTSGDSITILGVVPYGRGDATSGIPTDDTVDFNASPIPIEGNSGIVEIVGAPHEIVGILPCIAFAISPIP